MKIKAILTGATGMVGEGVLLECLNHPDVQQVLIINRRPAEIKHPKLQEIVHPNLAEISSLKEQIKAFGPNACFFCLGVSSVGMKEDEFRRLTYDLTLGFARTLAEVNPGLVFEYISGAGTDSTEQGRQMWARVKGKTENDLLKLFPNAYMFRPGMIQPTPGQKRTLKYYRYFGWLFPVIKTIYPKGASTMRELGLAMINAARQGYDKKVLEVPDLIRLSKM